jgi:uncharacterized protein YqgV (UPF0045/DUF77 family)
MKSKCRVAWFVFLMLVGVSLLLQNTPVNGWISHVSTSLSMSNLQTSSYSFMNDLNTAQTNWNTTFGTHAQMTGWIYIGQITSESERESIVAALSNPNETWVAQGNPLMPAEVTAVRLSEALEDAPPNTLAEWQNVVNDSVNVGYHVVHVNWLLQAEQIEFQTITVATADEIKFDPIFATITMIETLSVKQSNRMERTIKWIWGSTRGKIICEVNAVCDDKGNLITCLHTCDAWMTLGEAKVECMPPEEVDDCCKLYYGYGWRTPTGSITIQWNAQKMKFEITITGIGSSGSGAGSLLDCCGSNATGVGGILIPIDKFGLLAPYIGLASTILVATVATAVCSKRVKRRKEKQ